MDVNTTNKIANHLVAIYLSSGGRFLITDRILNLPREHTTQKAKATPQTIRIVIGVCVCFYSRTQKKEELLQSKHRGH